VTVRQRGVKRIVLIASILGSGIVFLDSTVVNVALPAIRSSLHGSLSDQQWVVEAYLLTLSSLLLLGGSLGDVLGRRRVFTTGLVGFGACSLACAIAPSSTVLIAARAVQGVAGAVLVPSTLALIIDNFGENERGAAIGTWTAWTGVATVIGPLGGGALVQLASWRWIFLINVIPVLITVMLLRRLPADHGTGGRVDWTGGLLCVLGLGGLVFGLIEQSTYGWGDPLVFVPAAAGVLLLVAFVWWERRVPEPMLPLDLFGVRNFAVGNLTTLSLYGGLGVATFYLVIFLQQVAGYTPVAAGLSLLPITLITFVLSRRFGVLADRYGPHVFMSAGPILAGAGLVLFARVDAHASYAPDVLPGVLVFAVGLAMTVAPLTATVLGAVEPTHSGLASGANNAVARIASLVAIAAVGAVVSAGFTSRLDQTLSGTTLSPAARHAVNQAKQRPLVTTPTGVPAPERATVHAALVDASVHAFQIGMGIAGGLAALGGVVALVGIENPRRRVGCADCPGGALVGASTHVGPVGRTVAAVSNWARG
jgi:EmrB/QacA subfamily drug resistance transporter